VEQPGRPAAHPRPHANPPNGRSTTQQSPGPRCIRAKDDGVGNDEDTEHGAGIELRPERYLRTLRIKCSLLGYDRWPMALVGVKVVTPRTKDFLDSIVFSRGHDLSHGTDAGL
jgi:hypothetical protein